jgi:MFS family permease
MLVIATSIFSLLLSTALLLLGVGLQGSLLGLRAVQENFSVDTIGYVMSAYFVGFAVGTYLCPPIIRRVGHIRAYAAMAAIAASAAISHALWVDPVAWAILRIVTGASIVGLYMVIESWLNTLASNQSRGQFFSTYMIITFLAMALAQFLLLAGDIGEFDLFALTSILVAMALVPIALTRVTQPTLIEAPELHLVMLYRDSPLGVIGTLASGLIMGAFWGMMPVYSRQIGLETGEVAQLMSATILGGALLQWPIGKISDHMDRRIVLGVAALTGALLAWFSIHATEMPANQIYLIHFFYGGFAFSVYSLSVAHVNDRLEPEHSLEASRNLLQTYGIGAVIGPLLAGTMMERLSPTAFPLFLAATLAILALFTLYRVFVKEPAPAETHEAFISVMRTTPVALEMDPRVEPEHAEAPPTTAGS